MRASAGQHWIALDHVRALAAFMVFTWHFTHAETGYPVPFAGAPALFPLALLDEGHTGVALFMTLSGYLFAKLLDGRSVRYPLFYWNRFLRLAPLIIVAILLNDLDTYFTTGEWAVTASFVTVIAGFAKPFPMLLHGLWSIVVETQFYLVLPLLMAATRRTRWAPLFALGVMVAIRLTWALSLGDGKNMAYWTIFGHIDQFLLGIFAFQHRDYIRGRHRTAVLSALGFALAYYCFDLAGGWYGLDDLGPHGVVWALLPTIEGAAYALLIAYYDSSFSPSGRGVSRLISKAGGYSYSIYLLHFLVVFRMAQFVDRHVMGLSNFYVACLWSAMCFALLVPIAALCFRWIETPFLRLRRPYDEPPTSNAAVDAAIGGRAACA